ncbi:TPA: DUF1566 domain-containing protein [Legionella pneumophila]|nr:DUF1566 domain-containing protein [Legionella pneumophila]HAT8182520.1 DUF1566 domain-containing protein [Legionella pneumophila]
MQRIQRNFFKNGILNIFFTFLMVPGVEAAKPLWTFIPQTPTKIIVPIGNSAQVIYTVQNQTSRHKTLFMKPIAGVSQSAPCQLTPKGTCTLILNVNGSALERGVLGGPLLCHQGEPHQCYQPSYDDVLHINQLPTLFPFTKNLVLSIVDIGTRPVLPGNPRTIRIKNTGSVPALNLQVTTSDFPAGTTITTNTCTGRLNPGVTCDITITPSIYASLDSSNNPCNTATSHLPLPTIVSVSADNVPVTKINVLVLGYGCRHQGGFLFSIDDSTPNTGSIGGKVAALTDEPVTVWSTINNITSATSTVDGFTNTNFLVTPVGQYPAAQACSEKIDQGFSDWYLPAICELGRYVGGPGGDANCGLIPNLYSSLVTAGLGELQPRFYWSSTQFAPVLPNVNVWFQNLQYPYEQNGIQKNWPGIYTRCIRAFTP